jgi:hypothetical protein
MGMASVGGMANAANATTNNHGSAARTVGAVGAAAPVASPGIYAPPDVVVGEADGQVNLPVTLSG